MRRGVWYGRAESHSVTVPQEKVSTQAGHVSVSSIDDDVFFPLSCPDVSELELKHPDNYLFHLSSQRIGRESSYIKVDTST